MDGIMAERPWVWQPPSDSAPN